MELGHKIMIRMRRCLFHRLIHRDPEPVHCLTPFVLKLSRYFAMNDLSETSIPVDFKIEPILIPSAAIKKLELYPHGTGGLGDIWKCSMSTQSGTRRVAVKIIRASQSDDKELIYKTGRRIRRIVDDFGQLPALVSPWMENGSLNVYLKKVFPSLSDHRKLELVQQVAAGLSYLHGKDVVHGSLTGTNIFVDDSGNLRLADFGLSMIAAESGNLTFGSLQAGNTRWMAPEFVDFLDDSDEPQSPQKPTKTGDIYSFGCVMLQILSGEEPYAWIKHAVHVITAIASGRKPFKRRVNTNMNEAYELLSSQCLSNIPEQRPSIAEITTIMGPAEEFFYDIPRTRQAQSSSVHDEIDETWSHQGVCDLTGKLENIPPYPTASGGYGDIWKCDLKKDGTVVKVAAKALRRRDASDDALTKALKRGKRELGVWMKLRHAHVLPLYGVANEFGPGYTVMVCPWLENGTVTNFIAVHDLSVSHRLQLISDVADGLCYRKDSYSDQYLTLKPITEVHSKYIVHGDLTGANILVCAQGRAHLADFGLSIILEEHDMVSHSVTGAARWAAPELFTLFENEAPGNFLSLQSDMYSFGSIMFQILSGVIPYHKFKDNHVITAITRGIKPPRPQDPHISDQHWNFIQKCWLPLESKHLRPSARDAYNFLQYECRLISQSTILLL
ncbi:hypothetical protein AZE42_00662 [Rhizopogon vesiculosus]|uniref:Protein kinase domain-containing protein n=1 Tax=Rhizopogon vesiculosus TaxID=180088 RepID=A0A1J8PN39_9AGAM|nr:hypothetical protein AZE42_00662 [Rhizopogon vesiculosus]